MDCNQSQMSTLEIAKKEVLVQTVADMFQKQIQNNNFYEHFTDKEGLFLESLLSFNDFITDESLQDDSIRVCVTKAKEQVLTKLLVNFMIDKINLQQFESIFNEDEVNLINDCFTNNFYYADLDEYKTIPPRVFESARNETIKQWLVKHFTNMIHKHDLNWIYDYEVKHLINTHQPSTKNKIPSFFSKLFKWF